MPVFNFLKKLSEKLRNAVDMLHSIRLLETKIDELVFSQGAILAQQYKSVRSKHLRDYEFKVFSQWGEDGIIQKLVEDIDIPNQLFIEFGVQDFMESNCRFLMMHDNWRGFVIEANENDIKKIKKQPFYWRHQLDAYHEFVDVDNINKIIEQAGFADDIGILSIDIDGVDYWILEKIDVCNPRIIIVEYNAVFGPERAITVPYDSRFTRAKHHYSHLYFGASLSAYYFLCKNKGYSLIGTNSVGTNAFFVRNDLMESCPFPSLLPEDAFTPSYLRESRAPGGEPTFLSGRDRYESIRGLPVINVISGAHEII